MSGARLEAAGGSHVGCVRKRNEDSYAVVPELGLLMVADGIGGRPGGEVASRMAIEIVRGCVEEDDPDETWPWAFDGTKDRNEARLVLSLRRANREILVAGRRGGMGGMGTTFAGVLVAAGKAYVAHAGDSRVYRLRGERLETLTRDHTVLEELLRQSSVDAGDVAELEPGIACRLTRALGTEPSVDVETRVEAVEAGDVLLVCSDGLWGSVPADDIAATLAWSARPQGIVAGLIGRALEQGGPDNVTCVVGRFGGT